MSKRGAAKRYNIPKMTLHDRITGKYREGKGRGRDPPLSEGEEGSIVE